MTARIGYELDKLLVEPVEFWLYRIVNGRRRESFGPFETEAAARRKLERLIEEKE